MIVGNAAGRGDDYVTWMIFVALIVVGLSTLLQVRRVGTLGAGAVLPMFTAAFAIAFCINALEGDGGPATLASLLLVSAVTQFAVSRWLFLVRRVVTPVVGGTVPCGTKKKRAEKNLVKFSTFHKHDVLFSGCASASVPL